MDTLNSSSAHNIPAVVGVGSSSSVAPNQATTAPNQQGTVGVVGGEMPKPTYASLFRNNRVPNEKCVLEYILLEENELSLSFDKIDTVENSLGCCLLGCMVGRKLNGYVVRETI